MKNSRFARGLYIAAFVLPLSTYAGCSCGESDSATGSSGPGQGGAGSGVTTGLFTTGSTGPCQGLECQQVVCPGGQTTTVTGIVRDPAGKVPLYNVVVYVPNAPLEALPEGASCDSCAASLSGDPVVTALTDTHGQFVLENVPAGDNIPLVIQVGKWRRELTLATVTECQDNPITDEASTRLPKNKSEGNIPKIALSTGGADPLECLLRKIGLDDAEFTSETGDGRVNLFAGPGGADRYAGGENFSPATSLWADVATLGRYDIVLMACEGNQNPDEKPAAALQALLDYTELGGRVFASHWHNYWLEAGPDPLPTTAIFDHQDDLASPFTARVDQTFPKGIAMADWLVNVGASQNLGELEIVEGQHTVDAVNPEVSQQWIYGENPQSVQYFTFNTPIGVNVEDQCGRMVFSDIHVSSGDPIGVDFPDGCETTDLSPQEKALLFMLFDLSSCIQPDGEPPVVPD